MKSDENRLSGLSQQYSWISFCCSAIPLPVPARNKTQRRRKRKTRGKKRECTSKKYGQTSKKSLWRLYTKVRSYEGIAIFSQYQPSKPQHEFWFSGGSALNLRQTGQCIFSSWHLGCFIHQKQTYEIKVCFFLLLLILCS